jgi:hypothetical protein
MSVIPRVNSGNKLKLCVCGNNAADNLTHLSVAAVHYNFNHIFLSFLI